MPHSTEHYEKLLQQYLDGQCNAAEVAELYAWLQASGSHRTVLAAMQREFEKAISQKHDIPQELSDRMENRLLQEIQTIKKINYSLIWKAAAAVVIIVAGGWWFSKQTPKVTQNIASVNPAKNINAGTNKAILTLADGQTVTLDSAGNQVITQGKTTVHQQNGQLKYAVNGNSGEVVYNTLTVPRGGQFNIVLPDGSHIWLNAASSLKYPTSFTGKERKVEIQGQGYFEVAKNAQQPFTVKVKDMEVQVLGTGFDIMAYPDEATVNTTLIEGAIKVNGQLLHPGQQAMLNPETGNITVRSADVEQVIAWKTGFFEFDNARLSDILRQLARWYDIDISYNQTANERLFGGRISRSLPLSEILHMLEANGPTFELSGRKLMVKSVN